MCDAGDVLVRSLAIGGRRRRRSAGRLAKVRAPDGELAGARLVHEGEKAPVGLAGAVAGGHAAADAGLPDIADPYAGTRAPSQSRARMIEKAGGRRCDRGASAASLAGASARCAAEQMRLHAPDRDWTAARNIAYRLGAN